MSVAYGKIEYQLTDSQVVAYGVSHTGEEMVNALTDEVHDRVYDLTGVNDLVNSIMSGITETGFEKDILIENLTNSSSITEWEVGEAYAHAYIEDNCHAILPCNICRDIKKQGSSLPGADIVGLYRNNASVCFLFGEIKTSSDQQSPPSLMYGSTGLKKQLDDLCMDEKELLLLIRYLGFRLKGTSYWSMYQTAFTNYNKNINNVHITGVLIRDVNPNKKDLDARARSLCPYCVNEREIDLVAIYVPQNAISKFVSIVEAEHRRRCLVNVKKH